MPDEAKLIQLIHTLRSKLGLDDETYRAMLAGYMVAQTRRPAESSKNLSYRQLQDLCKTLTDRAVAAGIWTPWQARVDRDRLASRPTIFATDSQLAMLEGMWALVSRQPDQESRERAFDRFIHRRFHYGGLRMLPRHEVYKVAHALHAMIEQLTPLTDEERAEQEAALESAMELIRESRRKGKVRT